ncbi:MAG TPA: transcriptional activator RfaH [Candidatus Polarisedimenticolia bacterium]|nr:transcriptional activator RfaH [Candidatus Polarisedimenticolia bacterium]
MSVFVSAVTNLECVEAAGFAAQSAFSNAPEAESAMAWYCARTKPKHEHIVAAGLKRNLGLEVFHPRLRIERPTRRGVVRVVEPLFPCYVFVRCNIDECLDGVRYVNGVSSLVHFGQRIPIVPDQVVDELKQCFESDLVDVEDRICPGAEVTVGEGAFLGFNGIVLRVMPAKQRVQILLDFLGRTTLTEVDRKSLILENRSMADMMPSLAMAK